MTAHIRPSSIPSSGSASAGGADGAAPHRFSLPPLSLLFFFPLSICLLKVFVCEMDRGAGRRDDSLHNDDIELISEMLQNRVADVHRET